ncbi:MAG TPA: MoxR family ATPase [Blastocatellia bacterium]|nr:MoxR family ATPase [Blastocatellia bacterium]
MSKNKYEFQLVSYEKNPVADNTVLFERPFVNTKHSFSEDAKRFVPGEQLEIAINTAIAVGQPLLITGEPGTGKTQAAYYAAYKLKVEPLIHFQVKSDTTAGTLLYHFDSVKYFYEATVATRTGEGGGNNSEGKQGSLDKSRYVEPRALWEAMASDRPRVLLIDEIDKAPRDFPNDLLHELDKMEFKVTETGEMISAEKKNRPIVFITSNSERRLPEPFLRRCVYHHIRFDDSIVAKAVEKRRDDYHNLSDKFLEMAIARFLELRERNLRKRPSTGELLVWLRVLALAVGIYPEKLDVALARLPYLGVLLKDHQDIEDLMAQSQS